MEEMRKVEVRREDHWVEIEMSDVKEGDMFRMFEPNGDPVVGKGSLAGETVFVASDDAFIGGAIISIPAKRKTNSSSQDERSQDNQ